MRDLVAGERVDVAGQIALRPAPALQPPLGFVLAAVAARRCSPAFPPIDSLGRELRPGAAFDGDGALTVALADLPEAVERLMLLVFHQAGTPLGCPVGVSTGALHFGVDLRGRTDAATILVEFYRHRGGWRLAANGQGYAGGLAAFAAGAGFDMEWARRLGHAAGRAAPSAPPEASRASGSGVAVDRHHILSNAHVVEDASEIAVVSAGRPHPATLVFTDPRNDLALLRIDHPLAAAARFRAGLDLHLGEDVVALGFPLQGLLGSGAQASAGNVAALCGIGNDSSLFQFTAPIASGNSGGPILDMAGDVIGLVCSSLNLDRIRSAGASGENINFGIKTAVIRSFLDAFGLTPTLGGPARTLGRAAVVREMRDAIVRVAVTC